MPNKDFSISNLLISSVSVSKSVHKKVKQKNNRLLTHAMNTQEKMEFKRVSKGNKFLVEIVRGLRKIFLRQQKSTLLRTLE